MNVSTAKRVLLPKKKQMKESLGYLLLTIPPFYKDYYDAPLVVVITTLQIIYQTQ